jgi:hypothetical protein
MTAHLHCRWPAMAVVFLPAFNVRDDIFMARNVGAVKVLMKSIECMLCIERYPTEPVSEV